MTTINELTAATSFSAADQIPLWSKDAQDTQRGTLAQLVAFLQGALTFTGQNMAQQFAAPSATGFTVTVSAADRWLILTPTAGFAAGTIVLPAVRSSQQRVRVNCTQSVTALTVSGAGTTVTGAPTTLAANAFFTMAYDGVTNAWYRVG